MPGCDRAAPSSGDAVKSPASQPAVPVSIARTEQSDVDITVSAIGWVEALSMVTIKPQVDAELVDIHFNEGEDVTKGQLLFTLDNRTYVAALHLAEANLARDSALAENSAREAGRINALFESKQASPRERDESRADADSKAAQVRADEAEVERARLQVERCAIRAPIAGRAGSYLAFRGNVTLENETPLVVINEIAPIFVTFSIPERYLGDIRSATTQLKVEAEIEGVSKIVESGRLAFVDNLVDRTTGMVRLKATFGNENRRLWPGQFVNVALTVGRVPNAIVAPAVAVQAGQSQPFVFVVKDDQTVEMRPVEPGLKFGQQVVITSGLAANEVVVTDGHMRLAPGARIEPKKPPQSSSQPAAGGAEVAGR